jgi:hypothetical protein
MLTHLEKLNKEDRELIYNAPVLVSVLTSSSLNEINKAQKADAIKLAHLKTFTADPLLWPYYAEVEKNFRSNFELAAKKYFPFDQSSRDQLKKEIEKVNQVLLKMDNEYGRVLFKSIHDYADHVKKAAHSVFQDFLFPMPIEGLSD